MSYIIYSLRKLFFNLGSNISDLEKNTLWFGKLIPINICNRN